MGQCGENADAVSVPVSSRCYARSATAAQGFEKTLKMFVGTISLQDAKSKILPVQHCGQNSDDSNSSSALSQ
jgi:hypothetical protein